jgi:hypothetical protein
MEIEAGSDLTLLQQATWVLLERKEVNHKQAYIIVGTQCTYLADQDVMIHSVKSLFEI